MAGIQQQIMKGGVEGRGGFITILTTDAILVK